jgi:hypothetical protein
MPRIPAAAALAITSVLAAACAPTYDWREVRPADTALRAMLPCKPERAARSVAMAGAQVELRVLACEADGATFAISQAELGDAGRSAQALAQWEQVARLHLRASVAAQRPFVPAGALDLPQSQLFTLEGERPGGGKVQARAAFFARGSQVFQVAVYSQRLRPEWEQPLFQDLRFGP